MGVFTSTNHQLLALCLLVALPPCYSEKIKDLQILDDLLRNYDRREHPYEVYGNATEVFISIYLRSFGSFNPETMDYEADLYLSQTWQDDRLAHENISHALDFGDPKLIQMIWKPEVFFPNAKVAVFQTVTVPNVVVRIHPDGQILYMSRLKLTLSCMMDLSKFPLDRQMCSIELASFAKTTRHLLLTWSPNKRHPVEVYEGLKLPQFTIERIHLTSCVDSSSSFYLETKSCLTADILLKRSLGYHVVQSYLPTTLIVVTSWVSFWLDVDAIAARITLGVTTLLTISSESTGTRPILPPVSYIKALDVWMGACTTFIFAALIEFTCVHYLSRRNKHRKRRRRKEHNESLLNAQHSRVSTRNHTPREYPESLAMKIDRISRFVFPFMFLIFNLVYWLYYGLY